MKIAYISAGAGGMYCGSCLHDNTLAAALIRAGHDVALIPTYTPTRTDEADVSLDRVFYGAINVYLQQKTRLFRHTPKAIDWVLDRPPLLRWISKIAGAVEARKLGALTLSVLQGEGGHQHKELAKLVAWLRDDFKPDIVHITNSMFLGLVPAIKREVGVPVICSVQGEDLFIEGLDEPYKNQVHQLLSNHAREVDGLIATSDYYGDFMAGYLDVPRTKIGIVRLGINLEGHGDPPNKAEDDSFVVGYLARLCPEKGLHLLVDGFRLLAEQVGRDKVKLMVAGYLAKRDRPYVASIRQRLRSYGLESRFRLVGEVSREEKIEFLHGLDVLSVPTTYRESKGLFVLEALANGVPVLQPNHGCFPEWIELTRGGELVDPESPQQLADGLRRLMDDPAHRRQLGRQGKDAVHRLLSDGAEATATIEAYRQLAGVG